jgi:protein phosphatase
MTDDHSLAGMLLKAQLITPDMARVHEGRCQLEHYIGGPELPHEMPLRTVDLLPGDFIVLCSDGVSNSLSDEIIRNLLMEGDRSLTDRVAEFVVHARLSGEQDNQTVVLYQHGVQKAVSLVEVIPDAGPLSHHPVETGDNVPAPLHAPHAEMEVAA